MSLPYFFFGGGAVFGALEDAAGAALDATGGALETFSDDAGGAAEALAAGFDAANSRCAASL